MWISQTSPEQSKQKPWPKQWFHESRTILRAPREKSETTNYLLRRCESDTQRRYPFLCKYSTSILFTLFVRIRHLKIMLWTMNVFYWVPLSIIQQLSTMNIYYFGICILFYHSLKQIFGAWKLILEWQYNVPFMDVIVSQMSREVMS